MIMIGEESICDVEQLKGNIPPSPITAGLFFYLKLARLMMNGELEASYQPS